MSTQNVLKVAAAAFAVFAFVHFYPDLHRYVKIRSL
jgi:hypothetical protein